QHQHQLQSGRGSKGRPQWHARDCCPSRKPVDGTVLPDLASCVGGLKDFGPRPTDQASMLSRAALVALQRSKLMAVGCIQDPRQVFTINEAALRDEGLVKTLRLHAAK